MQNPYGLRDGQLLLAEEVSRGLDCGCVCPACGHPLQAHKGSKVRPYFSHYRGADCGFGYETALHLLAKEILLERRTLLLPELVAMSDIKLALIGTRLEKKVLVPAWTKISADSVYVEKRTGDIVPDVIVEKRDRVLLVEIKVTHGVTDAKRNYIQKTNVAAIEFDFSRTQGLVRREHLVGVLTQSYKGARKGHGRATWIHHPRLQETVGRLNDAYQRLHAQALRHREKERCEQGESEVYKPFD